MSHQVTINIDGKIIAGTYDVLGNAVMVSSNGRFKTARISGNLGEAEYLARILLGELVRDNQETGSCRSIDSSQSPSGGGVS